MASRPVEPLASPRSLAQVSSSSSSVTANDNKSALRDALVDLMQRAGTELSAAEAEVLVTALSSEMRLSERSASVASASSSSDGNRSGRWTGTSGCGTRRVESESKLAAVSTGNSSSGATSSRSGDTSKLANLAVTSSSASSTSPPSDTAILASGDDRAKDKPDGVVSDNGRSGYGGHDSPALGTHDSHDGVSPLPQEAERVYGDVDDGYQSTSGTAVASGRLSAQQQPSSSSSSWADGHQWLEK